MPIPTVLPDALSQDALDLYRKICKDDCTIRRFTDAQTLTLARELEAAHLGKLSYSSYDSTYSLWVTDVHPLFEAPDSGGTYHPDALYAEVYLHSDDHYRGDGRLICALSGATLRQTDSHIDRLPCWRLNLRHTSATDFEHDGLILADLELENPVFIAASGTRTELLAHLTELRITG